MITSWPITEALAREHMRELRRVADYSRLRDKTHEGFGRRAEHPLFVQRLFFHLAAAFQRRKRTRASWGSDARIRSSAVAPDG
jgi:hypothetical protein